MSANQTTLRAPAAIGRSITVSIENGSAAARSIQQDVLAILTCALIAAFTVVLVPDMRTNAPIGAALRLDSLRKVLTVVLGFLAVAVYLGEADYRRTQSLSAIGRVLRIAAISLIAIDVLYIATFTFFGLDLLTNSGLPAIVEWAALIGVMALWQPWTRIAVYRKAGRKFLPPLLIAAGVLIVWQVLVTALDIKQFLLPAPLQIANTFLNIYPRLVAQGWITFQNALWGFAIGCGLGILTALVSARFTGFSRVIMPYAIAANAIPIIAFAPITNNWFGVVNPLSKIAVVAILCYFPAMINTLRGLTLADASAIALMQSCAATEWQIFRKLRLPTALPYLFSGLKVACTLSMIGAIVAEYFGGPTTGLGVNISSDAALIRYANVWSEILIASGLGISFYFIVLLIERLVMPWHPSFRAEAD